MAIKNPLQLTSRTFNTILNDINNDSELVDKPIWFKRLIAGTGDIFSIMNNASTNQAYLRTAFTTQATDDLLELIDYTRAFVETSTGTLIFYMPPTVSPPRTFLPAELTGLSTGSLTISSLPFEARESETISALETGTFTWDTSDDLTVSNDFIYTGHKVRFTTTGTLPAPLQTGTDYYLIRNSATNVSASGTVDDAFNNVKINITDAGSGTHTWTQLSFAKVAYQQETQEEKDLGDSDGITEWQEYTLPDTGVLKDTLSTRVGSTPFTRVITLVDSLPTDEDYRIIRKSDSQTAVLFGNGTYGIIPLSNTIFSTYAIGGGAQSNISRLNKITTYTGGAADLSGVANTTVFTQGSDEESLDSAKRVGPLLLKARNRFVTTEDGEALSISTGGISLAKVNKNAFGVLTAQVLLIANGGGNVSPTKRSEVQQFLIDRTLLEEMDIRVEAATLTPQTVVSTVTLFSGFSFSDIEKYIELGFKLLFTETGQEIIDSYNSGDLNATITLINSIFFSAFTFDDDSVAITKLLDILEIVGTRNFGDTIQESDAITMIQAGVDGVDTISISSPSFPITFSSDEISTHTGTTISITEAV